MSPVHGMDAIPPGDFVIIQFSHNDVGPLDARSKFCGSLKGIGDETEKVTRPDGTTEEVHSCAKHGFFI